ncbi:putative bifunctional diguanylate cyclase/phosphodiesterase [Altericista sp. CCNU0014]|uniref:putative bifunctional diguanylate cyclase/phosphodiesterase n=1 Tax=Altericista sp. CCNU0014 TaxID=3082949 RepID=UPI00384B8778
MTKGAIVCIDDEKSVLLCLRDQLSRILESGYTIELAESGEEALSLFAELNEEGIEVHLLICDQIMPGMSGVDVLMEIQQQYPHTLKILLTGLANFNDVIKALNYANLYRYIHKPWDEVDLGLTIREALRSYDQSKQLAAQNRQLQQMNLDLQREIADRRCAETRLAHDALHDALTQLPNRVLLTERIQQAIQASHQDPTYQFAVLFIDLDRFKVVNDGLGHLVGDKLLKAIAQRLQHCLRANDLIARFGGDEFSILLDNIQNQAEALQVAQRLLTALESPFHLGEHTLFASASIGIAVGSSDHENAADLLRDADLAMYSAKGRGRGCYALFSQELHLQSVKLLQIESDLHRALERQEFILYYQPIVSLETSTLIGFEALVRWQHATRGFIAPGDFIPIAEETGFIIPLGMWVLQKACLQLRAWNLAFPQQTALTMSVNLASKQLQDPRFIEQLDRVLAETGLDGSVLKLELTESMLLDNIESVLQTLASIKSRNIQLSIDDFGTGYSSLSYLPRFPINTLKIDRSFVDRMTVDAENLEIVRAIATLAHSIGIDVVAEGIETVQQLELLQTLHCEFGQGYLFSKPLDPHIAEQYIGKARKLNVSRKEMFNL